MRKEVKEAAQLYGLHSIGLKDLLDVCETVSEVKEAIDYAEDFGEQYDFWCEMQYKKHQEIKEAWKDYYLLIEDYYKPDDECILDGWYGFDDCYYRFEEEYDRAEAERHSPYYTEQELQDAFDVFCKNRRKQILRIGKEAKAKKVSSNTIYRFMQSYKLNDPERTVFWLAYYGALV